jgi:hypothetical protein
VTGDKKRTLRKGGKEIKGQRNGIGGLMELFLMQRRERKIRGGGKMIEWTNRIGKQ